MSTNPTILAIDTATSACSVALSYDGTIHQQFEVGSNIHSTVLLSMVDSVFEQASLSVKQLDAVAVGQGPGSFTGLRIGVGVGQGIAYGAACPMIGVSSLQALAHAMASQNTSVTVLAGIDARMGEIYWAEFAASKADTVMVGEMQVSSPEDVLCSQKHFFLVGNAWDVYSEQLNNDIASRVPDMHESFTYPNASNLLHLATMKYNLNETVAAADFAPIYVRNNVAKKSTKPLPGKRV